MGEDLINYPFDTWLFMLLLGIVLLVISILHLKDIKRFNVRRFADETDEKYEKRKNGMWRVYFVLSIMFFLLSFLLPH